MAAPLLALAVYDLSVVSWALAEILLVAPLLALAVYLLAVFPLAAPLLAMAVIPLVAPRLVVPRLAAPRLASRLAAACSCSWTCCHLARICQRYAQTLLHSTDPLLYAEFLLESHPQAIRRRCAIASLREMPPRQDATNCNLLTMLLSSSLSFFR